MRNYGEGTAVDLLEAKSKAKPVSTAADIRFTTKGETSTHRARVA